MTCADFVKPEYGSRCFSEIPQLVEHLLVDGPAPPLPAEILDATSADCEAVVLFFVDAFGWRFFEKYRDQYPFLDRISRTGAVTQLTSQFPSTTTAHVTCVHTGLPVGQSGLFEWNYYEPTLDAIIVPLMYSFAGQRERGTLTAAGVDPAQILPTRTIYRELKRQGVRSFAFQPRAHMGSAYAWTTFKGASVIPYTTLAEGLVNLGAKLEGRQGPAYYFFYFDGIDSIGHQYGPTSEQIEAEIDAFLTVLDRLFTQRLQGKLDKTLLLLTADHGMVETDPGRTLYLNRGDRLAGTERFLKTNRKGELLVPGGGSCRDMFLYIREELLEEAHDFLAERLEGRAEVRLVREMAAEGYFGPEPFAPEFAARAGDLVILPYKNESVWWYEKGKFEQKHWGHHGGLTPEEMEIPLLLWDFT